MKDWEYLKETYPYYIDEIKFDSLGKFEKVILSEALNNGEIWLDSFYHTVSFDVNIEIASWRDLSQFFSILADVCEITGYDEGGYVPDAW